MFTPSLHFNDGAWRRLAADPPEEFERALVSAATTDGPLRRESLRYVACMARPSHVPLLRDALDSEDASLIKEVVEGTVLAAVRGNMPREFRDAMIELLSAVATGSRPLALTPEMYGALKQLPECLTRLHGVCPREVLLSPECLSPGNLAVGHVFRFLTNRYDDRLRGVTRSMDRARVLAVFDALAAGPWIVPSPSVETDVRMTTLAALACVDPPTARRIFRTPNLIGLAPEDLKSYYGADIRGILKSVPSPEDVVYWADDHVGSLTPETLAVAAAFQLFMETANDGLEHALAASMASDDVLAQGLKLLDFAPQAEMFRAGDQSREKLEASLLSLHATARRRFTRYIEHHAAEFSEVPGVLK